MPPGQLLTQLRPSDAALRQHIIVTSVGIHFGNIRERTILPTLNTTVDVELEYRDHHIYVDGYKAGRDNCYGGHIALIDVVLGTIPKELPPPMDADEVSSTEEIEMGEPQQQQRETETGGDTSQEVLSTKQHVTLAANRNADESVAGPTGQFPVCERVVQRRV